MKRKPILVFVVLLALFLSLLLGCSHHDNKNEKLIQKILHEIGIAEQTEDLDIHSYAFVISNCSWEQAYELAKQQGGYLVNFNSMEEYDEVIKQLEAEGYHDIYFRVGAMRDEKSTDYFWIDDEKTYGSSLNAPDAWCSELWLAGEPTYEWDGLSEQYLEIYYNNDEARWVWCDVKDEMTYPSDPEKCGFIIEYEGAELKERPEETQEKDHDDVKQDQVVPEEPEDTDDIVARLTDGYWENMIQTKNIYRFLEDGTLEEYGIEPSAPVNETNIFLWRTLRYSVEGNAVWLKGDGWETKLEWVTKADPIDWDGGGEQFPDNEEFLYEVDWVQSDAPSDNAMYLVKCEMQEAAESSGGYEELLDQLYTDYDLGVDSHVFYDMDQDGIEELIVHLDHQAGEIGREYHIYTLKNNVPEFVGITSAADASLYVPNDGNKGLYIYSTNAWAFFLEQITIQNNEIVRDLIHTESGNMGLMDYTPPGTAIEWEDYFG